MKETKLIDVTLRDGGYKTNFHFHRDTIKNILSSLDSSGIEYIEIGYRNGSFKPIVNMGDAGYCKNDYIEYCSQFITNAKLTVMIHPMNVSENDFKEMSEAGVKSVRICFSPQQKQAAFEILKILENYEFDVFVNLTRVSQYSDIQLLEWIQDISDFNIKAIYLADSNGSLTPQQVNETFQFLKNKVDFPLGFHAHDNLYLAQSNAIASLSAGAQYLDASLHGLGKGSGNLRTEIIATFLNKNAGSHYDICHLLNTAQLITKMINIPMGLMSPKDIIHGIFNLSQDEIQTLDHFDDTHSYYRSAKKYYEEKRGAL